VTTARGAAQADVGTEPVDVPRGAAAWVPATELQAVADPERDGLCHER
jgi:hypothetical protein